MEVLGKKNQNAKKGSPWTARLLARSSSVRGFFLNDFSKEIPRHLKALSQCVANSEIQSIVDDSSSLTTGLEGIYQGLERMYARKNKGKVVVQLTSRKSKL
mmetsp:Transcript_700/g.945  ORF Transcript_700/g.945 Transcript_700/m.945 type:complete len:101 (-) Transcript_700:45-347(-)